MRRMMSEEESKKFIEEMFANAMKLEDFEIGKPFMMSKREWLCVDKGTWCVIAIQLGPRDMTQVLVDESGERTETTKVVTITAEDCKGPPYGWGCSVIDEYDFPACSKIDE